jgi:hypothetical protein
MKHQFDSIFKTETANDSTIVGKMNKLRTYGKYKTDISFAPYLSLVKNRQHKKSLTRLRLSVHPLAIEQGGIPTRQLTRESVNYVFWGSKMNNTSF